MGKKRKKQSNTLKKPLYGNCSVQSIDGTHIFNCDEKRINWYLQRNLAQIINNEPLTIRLNFEPKGKGHAHDPFFLQKRENICVNCGSDQQLTRHHVVPHCYRKYFDDKFKVHNYYDVLLLCKACHHIYEEFADKFKEQLLKEYNILIVKPVINTKLRKIRIYASALINWGHNIPDQRQEALLDFLKKNCNKDSFTKEELSNMATLDYIENSNCKPSNQQLVEKINDYNEFIKRWRKHFINSLHPKYMPLYWDINRNVYDEM